MKFLEFLKKESDKPLLKFFILSALSGLSSAGVLAIINIAARNASNSVINISLILMFAATVGIYMTSHKYILNTGMVTIEEVLNNIRLRLSDKIRRTDLLNIEQIGKAEIYNRLTQELGLISQMAPYIITAFQSAIMLFFVFAYITMLSFIAAALLITLLIFGIMIFHKNNIKIYADLEETNKAEVNFFVSLTNIIDGLKEIKLNRKKSSDLYSRFGKISGKLKTLKINASFKSSENVIFAQAFIYIVLGSIVFVLPRLKPAMIDEIVSTTTAMLFAIGPLSAIVSMLPIFGKVDIAIKNVYSLEAELDSKMNSDENYADSGYNRFLNYQKIILNDVYFEYNGGENKDHFSVGPLNLTINKGEVLFIIGGNGCGKTTFLKMLTMLYRPKEGSIFVDDIQVDNSCYQEYRELYSAIFYDFHLFDKLYGLEKVNPENVRNLLQLMQIENKTEFIDNGFTRLDLSTGQRKRLALIVTYLEDKPIYIFDEWAADQDPQFKKYFYDELLHKLKNEGKTVIAVSHDDRYFHLADRVIKMEFGKIV